jgi:hypothetical protein
MRNNCLKNHILVRKGAQAQDTHSECDFVKFGVSLGGEY